MGNVSIKHQLQRKPFFENTPSSSKKYFNHREVIKTSRSGSPMLPKTKLPPSSPITPRLRDSYSPIMPNRYVHKSAIRQSQDKTYLHSSPYVIGIKHHHKGTKSYLYDRRAEISPRNQYTQRLATSRGTDNYGSQYHQQQRKEIMKKIRNFNEFINMVKKQIHDTKDNNSMKVKMQLENRDFDVSKYQQILEKEFSRQGSQAKIKFEEEDDCKIVNISFEMPKQKQKFDLKKTAQFTDSSSKAAKSKQEIRERMKQAADRLRQLSRKFYQENDQKHQAININLANIQNIIDNKDTKPPISPQIKNIKQCIKKMSELSKQQHYANIKIMKNFEQMQDSSNAGSLENSTIF